MKARNSNIIKAVLYFLLSVILTGIFIASKFWLYSNVNSMILSGCIAGGKWLTQIIAVFIFLKEKKWEFISRIGFVCFVGSLALFVYYIFNFLPLPVGGFSQFVLSIGLSVLVMTKMYYEVVRTTGISVRWFWGWIVCLAVAVMLQVKIVF
ncbi:MAG: hypothetical protein E6Q24_11345 [Chitinophagaceae bacterium]|nr:MAG: hypothetical protein E6Q24_11345 [Chitinophagaceae bacterium]